MTSYCDIKDAYSNNDELDKLARNFNDNKKQMIKQVHKDSKEDARILKKNAEQLKKLPGYDFCQHNEKYSQYREDSVNDSDNSGNSVSLDSPSENTIVMKNYDNDNDSDSDFSSYSSSIDSASKSTGNDYSIDVNTNKIGKMLKNKIKKKKYLFDECMSCDSISQESVTSDEDIINHASKCSKCKRKIMKILSDKKKTKHISDNNYFEKTAEIITKSSISNIKEFIIICVIGLLIIFLLDFVMKASR